MYKITKETKASLPPICYFGKMSLSVLLALFSVFFIFPSSQAFEFGPSSFVPSSQEGVFEEISDAILMPINPKMTLIYSKSKCALISVWENIPDQQSISNKVFYPSGAIYHRKYNPQIWELRHEKVSENLTPQFISYANDMEAAKINFNLLSSNGKKIQIKEYAHYDAHYGAPSLFLTFEISDLPKSKSLWLKLDGAFTKEEWSSAGGSVKIVKRDKKVFAQFLKSGKYRVKGVWSP